MEIKNEQDIMELMQEFNWFHDSCIKELKYLSGGYVNEDGSMYASNSIRSLSIIFQSQNARARVIELKFDLINKLNLVPSNDKYDCVIYDASLVKIDNIFYWSDWEDFKIEDINTEDGTWISGQKVSWRILKDCFGELEIYQTTQK
ncbi:hypothetical protein [Anaerosacchariphilus polymeriproducens]|uniref:Uncharacterized protein n=1 Tax=Anaerosacchariphilus polymeriproducens TaxID=1812858 RepID=A0A371B0B6_9FIRM|nr:hypothetical protein [Anaerosacchariphilus polymeriproducens]RDU25249.1 hypothetical protein DWV06_00125 [Anaerosacchariphilus polymeriproducens]